MTVDIRAHIFVEGRVQGVFFRDNTRTVASSLGVNGWVRNLPDGRVEIVAEGTETAVKMLIDWCHKGPAHASVTNVDVSYEAHTGEFGSFSKRW
jgi:acylphosphatase